MKIKTTTKAIKADGGKIVCAGYCDLCFLLQNHSPNAYTCGVYGWNYDMYEIHGTKICTGYRGMPGRRANNIGEYESRAREIASLPDMQWEEKKEAIENLLDEFILQA